MILPPHQFNPIRRGTLSHVPEGFHTWLLDTASLTQRLLEASNGQFRVRVLSQGLARMSDEEAKGLSQRAGALSIIREVELLCHNTPCVYARSVIPLTSLKGKQRRLAHLGNKPLGAFLFADPHLIRASVDILPLNAQRQAWGRRSLFRVGGYPLYVSEYFLPAVLDLPC